MDHSDYHNTSQAFCLWLPQYIFLLSVVDDYVYLWSPLDIFFCLRLVAIYFILSVVAIYFLLVKYIPRGIFFYSLISNSGFTDASYAS